MPPDQVCLSIRGHISCNGNALAQVASLSSSSIRLFRSEISIKRPSISLFLPARRNIHSLILMSKCSCPAARRLSSSRILPQSTLTSGEVRRVLPHALHSRQSSILHASLMCPFSQTQKMFHAATLLRTYRLFFRHSVETDSGDFPCLRG